MRPLRHSERLPRILQFLRHRRGDTTAATLAQLLGVSERTSYRDVAFLVASGVAVDGEAGVGYWPPPATSGALELFEYHQ